jgi:hypothetical protein
MNDITSFAQNLRVWSRRMETRDVSDKAETIALFARDVTDSSRQMAIYAVACEWFKARGISREDCSRPAKIVAQALFWICYEGEGGNLAGFLVKAARLQGEMVLDALAEHYTLIQEFCTVAIAARTKEHSAPTPGQAVAQTIVRKALNRQRVVASGENPPEAYF